VVDEAVDHGGDVIAEDLAPACPLTVEGLSAV
jgi:hypothetical protein